jgi:hypothetical protein
MSNVVEYNSYRFNELSHFSVSGGLVEDDAQRTVAYHRYTLRMSTTIYAEGGESNAGQHFLRIRQLLTKPGRRLVIDHGGFGPRLDINGGYGLADVAFGPKPRIVTWEPIGDTNAVEVTWECEVNIPTCDGSGAIRFFGLMSLNYAIDTRINVSGYTTRTISGYIEIAMTRSLNAISIPDTADLYRDAVIVAKPSNFERETSWNLSADKRRANFSIVDREIESPNPYPPGVVRIKANHRVGWNRRQLATLPNTISATITLEPKQPRSRAWEIFRAIVAARIAVSTSSGDTVFLESLDANEELYDNVLSFSASYRQYVKPDESALARIFSATGFAEPLSYNTWDEWSASLANVQNHYGHARLLHNPTQDQLVDLCSEGFLPEAPLTYNPVSPETPVRYNPFCNEKPPPESSYIKWETYLNVDEDNPATSQITIGPDDYAPNYTPFDPQATIQSGSSGGSSIERYIESIGPDIEFTWSGYAVRVGYPIPRPARLQVAGVNLVRKGKGEFRQKFLGRHFCQRVYAASWKHRYVLDERPQVLPESEMNSTQEFGGGDV